MKKINNKAFSHFELVLAVVIVAAIATVGAYTYSAKYNKSKADSGVILNELAKQQDSADNVEGVPVVDDPVAAAQAAQATENTDTNTAEQSKPLTASTASVRTRARMQHYAKSQLGNYEQPLGSNSGRDVRTYQRYATAVDGKDCMNNAWCASFASWVYYKDSGSGRYRGCAVSTIRNQARAVGKLHSGLKGVRPGDMVLRISRPGYYVPWKEEHIGIYISGNGSHITTIDGNWKNKVTYHTDNRSYWTSYVDID